MLLKKFPKIFALYFIRNTETVKHFNKGIRNTLNGRIRIFSIKTCM